MKVLALQVLAVRIEHRIPPGSPDRTRLELRVFLQKTRVAKPIGTDAQQK
jgi:hypothetical protein